MTSPHSYALQSQIPAAPRVGQGIEQPTALPETFSFSQSSLQAFDDCARRFWLAYVQQLPWPAVEAAPVQDHEQLMRLGAHFHKLVERAEIGMPMFRAVAELDDPLAGWFSAYEQHRPTGLPSEFIEVEHVLSIPFGESQEENRARKNAEERGSETNKSVLEFAGSSPRYRLAAKYDLIAAERGGRVAIVDWKTTRRRTDPSTLSRRWQTIVYPYVLVEASARLPWGPVQPEQVEMMYWFVNAPSQPVVFRYDGAQHARNGERLRAIYGEIADALRIGRASAFPKVLDTELNRRRFCNFCVYRSRCNRGVAAGDIEELDDAEEFFLVDFEDALEFTLEDVEELSF